MKCQTKLFLLTIFGLAVICAPGILAAGDDSSPHAAAGPFAIRGTLPWHNFLCGPSAWNEDDYRVYLDGLKAQGLNLVAFHNYTGGAQRYHCYVEPMIRVSGYDVLPEATFDTSLTARWGYRPLRVADFAFGTARLFQLPPGAEAFGADCMLKANNNAERYQKAQALMRRVMEMAHERGIQFAMGFEVGVHPPEFASVVPQDTILQYNGVVLKPESPAARLLLRNTIDDILAAYPGIDQIWLWQQEHSFLSGDHHWTESYIRLAYDYIKSRAPSVRVVISGWGGGKQLPEMLAHLDRTLPQDIIFTCLNPDGGASPHAPAMANIARHRTVWAIPWLEEDGRMWHLQMSVHAVLKNVEKARADRLQGVLAIHWRTEDVRASLAAFAQASGDPDHTTTVEQFYAADCRRQYGRAAEKELAPLLAKMDREGWLGGVGSPEFYPYDPCGWGMLSDLQRERIQGALAQIEKVRQQTSQGPQQANLQWLADNLRFFLQLDEVGRKMQPAYRLRERWLTGQIDKERLPAEAAAAAKTLGEAPIRQLFETFVRRVRSQGERGVLSSLNQRLWLQYRDLEQFLLEIKK